MVDQLNLGRFELSLNVTDLERSVEFYERLGFTAVEGDPAEGWRIMINGDLRLGLYRGHIPANLLNFRGGDVFALARELKMRGVVLESGPEIESDGSAGASLRDPDGNLVYLNTHPDEVGRCIPAPRRRDMTTRRDGAADGA